MSEHIVRRNLLERCLMMAAKGMAVIGGALFILLIGMSLVSIVGRKLGYGSVNGDIELMQAGTAVAAASFLPYCTLLGEHLKVDFFTLHMSEHRRRLIDGACELLLGLVALLLAWYTAQSAISIYENEEVTQLVALPLWIPNAALVPALALMALMALYRGCIYLWTHRALPEVRR